MNPYTEEERAYAGQVARFLRNEVDPLSRQIEEDDAIPPSLLKAAAEFGRRLEELALEFSRQPRGGEREFALLLGQKNQLWWDLPARESLELNAKIYGIARDGCERTVAEMGSIIERHRTAG